MSYNRCEFYWASFLGSWGLFGLLLFILGLKLVYTICLYWNMLSKYAINSTIYSFIHTINWTFFPCLLSVGKKHKIEISYLWCDSNRTSPFLILSLNWTLGLFLFSLAATSIFLSSHFPTLFSDVIVFSTIVHSFNLLCYRFRLWIMIVLIILLSALLDYRSQPASLIFLPHTLNHSFTSFWSALLDYRSQPASLIFLPHTLNHSFTSFWSALLDYRSQQASLIFLSYSLNHFFKFILSDRSDFWF